MILFCAAPKFKLYTCFGKKHVLIDTFVELWRIQIQMYPQTLFWVKICCINIEKLIQCTWIRVSSPTELKSSSSLWYFTEFFVTFFMSSYGRTYSTLFCPIVCCQNGLILYLLGGEKSHIQETLILSSFLDNNSDKKPKIFCKISSFKFCVSPVTFHVSPVMCHSSCVTCHMSPVTPAQ